MQLQTEGEPDQHARRQQYIGRQPARASDDGVPPVWHKDNRGFWFVVCVGASLVFALIYSALR